MKTYKEYLSEAIRPAGQFNDRSLEGFRSSLDDLIMQAKAVADPNTKEQIFKLLNPFYNNMKVLLQQNKENGIGYSPNYSFNSPVTGSATNEF